MQCRPSSVLNDPAWQRSQVDAPNTVHQISASRVSSQSHHKQEEPALHLYKETSTFLINSFLKASLNLKLAAFCACSAGSEATGTPSYSMSSTDPHRVCSRHQWPPQNLGYGFVIPPPVVAKYEPPAQRTHSEAPAAEKTKGSGWHAKRKCCWLMQHQFAWTVIPTILWARLMIIFGTPLIYSPHGIEQLAICMQVLNPVNDHISTFWQSCKLMIKS
jgi:hypothetical protein